METQKFSFDESKGASKFVHVKGARMHYVQSGSGDPILFLHGMPTHSYVWRKIIPFLSDQATCIAVDLIGMGDSEKPDIQYRVFDHIHYIEEFIHTMGLKNITLVMHGWGSVIGFDYAKRFEKNIKALAFYEAHLRPITNSKMLSLPIQQFASLLQRPNISRRAVIEKNYLVDKLLQSSIIKSFNEDEMAVYRKPFNTPESRKPLWQYIQEVPLGNGPQEITDLIADYSNWLEKTSLPKLMIYAMPGFMTTIEDVSFAYDHLKNLSVIEIQNALHLAQESVPEVFGKKLREWYMEL